MALESISKKSPHKNRAFSVILLMFILGSAIYSNTLKSGFIWDDWTVIVSNPYIRKWWDFPAIWNAFNTRFILGVSLAFSYAVGKLDVTGYHIFNITVHILSAVFFYFLVQETFKTPTVKNGSLSGFSDIIALFAALIFLTHPVQTTAVNYIWQRAAVMATFFYIASIFFYAKARVTSCARYYVVAWITTVLGMFTKEITATIPITLLIYEVLFFGPIKDDVRKRFVVISFFLATSFIIPLMLMRSSSVTMDLMRPDAVRTATHDHAEHLDITRWVGEKTMSRRDYYLTQLNVARTYLGLLFFPVDQNLDYDYPIAHSLRKSRTFISLLVLSAIILAALVTARNFPLLSFGIFWFFIGLSVESLVVQKDVIFEHRLYLLTAGFAIFLTSALCRLLKIRRLVVIVLCIVVSAFSIATYKRNMIWHDSLSLWKDVIKKSPNKAPAYNFAALAYGDGHDFQNAIACYKKAIEIKPDFDAAYINLGTAYAAVGKHQSAVQSYQKATEIDPNAQSTISAYNNLGIEYCALGNASEAESSFRKAVEKAAQIDPHQAEPTVNLGMLYAALGRTGEAKKLFENAVLIDPENTKAKKELAKIQGTKAGQKRTKEAQQKV